MLYGSVTLLTFCRGLRIDGGNAGGVCAVNAGGRMMAPAAVAAVSPGAAGSVICASGTHPRLSPGMQWLFGGTCWMFLFGVAPHVSVGPRVPSMKSVTCAVIAHAASVPR